jgi:hypothetical protein
MNHLTRLRGYRFKRVSSSSEDRFVHRLVSTGKHSPETGPSSPAFPEPPGAVAPTAVGRAGTLISAITGTIAISANQNTKKRDV